MSSVFSTRLKVVWECLSLKSLVSFLDWIYVQTDDNGQFWKKDARKALLDMRSLCQSVSQRFPRNECSFHCKSYPLGCQSWNIYVILPECIHCGVSAWKELNTHSSNAVCPLCKLIEGFMVCVLHGKIFILEANSVCRNVVSLLTRTEHLVRTMQQKEFHEGETFTFCQLIHFLSIKTERKRLIGIWWEVGGSFTFVSNKWCWIRAVF